MTTDDEEVYGEDEEEAMRSPHLYRCSDCGHAFTKGETMERIIQEPYTFIHEDGREERFLRGKKVFVCYRCAGYG
jgi:transcriptional regulator NrdR family protein